MNTKNRYSPSFRRRHLRDWQQSGLSKVAYARLHNLNIKTFGNRTRLARHLPAEPTQAVKTDFIPLTLATTEPPAVAGTAPLNLPAGASVTARPAVLADIIRRLGLC